MKLTFKEITDRISWWVAGFCFGMLVSTLIGCKTPEPAVDRNWPGDSWAGESARTVEQINTQRGVAGR